MRILSLQAENLKRLVAVEITPTGNVVQITGKNGAGKTSILDSIFWCLAGKEHIQSVPIRKGAQEARIRLDLGEVIVTRNFKLKDSGETTTSVMVESAEGARFPSPQSMLDSFLDQICLDPLAIARMKPKEQFEFMRRFVPDVDFDAIDAANKADYDKRADINKRQKEAAVGAASITVAAEPPCQPIDEAALVAALKDAGTLNADRATRQANREKAVDKIEALRTSVRTVSERINAAVNLRMDSHAEVCSSASNRIQSLEQQIAAERARISASELSTNNAIDADQRRLTTESDIHLAEADTLQKRLDEAGELPAPVDTAILLEHIDAARDSNQRLAQWTADHRRREGLKALAAQLKKDSDALTGGMDARDKAKHDAIKAAQMPVEGLEFGIGQMLLNKLPLDQASDAERLRAAVAIAMAGKPKLRVVRIRDGSLLDEDGMSLLAEMAEKNDMQIWIERVGADAAVGFVIEEGKVKEAAA